MGMIGRYLRLGAAELERAADEPGWARAFVAELDGGADGARAGGWARLHDTGKAWQALDFLLRRHGFPVDLVHGEEELPGAGDWGYGPPRRLAPDRVRTAADAAAAISPGQLTDGVRAADLAAAGLYPPSLWTSEDCLYLLSAEYRALADFLRAVAARRHGLLVWID
ncbi:DUF1877 family protein [Kitasatospora sp. NPDC048540]|uniref:DUF1877 family protein n=1 Tax=unclassified Kitasatospora TaxID=2633591 RepID=UPI00053AD6DD|nr:DUF1877 family protein [Kitasatospora sp. MBT63]